MFDMLQCADLPNNNTDDQTLDNVIGKMSKTLSNDEKHLQALYLTGTSITELKDNVFHDLVFDEIYVTDNSLLTKVHRHAFNGTAQVTTAIDFISNKALSQSADNSLFDALSELVNVKQVDFAEGNNLTEVPSYAFKPVNSYQNELWQVSFQGSLERISTRSFFFLNALRVVSFLHTKLEHIPAHAFELERNSSTRLQIDLSQNANLTGDSFHKDAFIGINRPTTVILDERVTFLSEDVFLPYLNENPSNSIMHVNHKTVNCSDVRNAWLKQQWNRVRLCQP